jgi:hypothetical protein
VISLANLKVRSLELNYLDLTWETNTSDEDVWDYRFQVERSESPMGPFDVISGEFTDRFRFRDVTLNQMHLYRTFFYRVRVRRVSDDEVVYSDVASLSARPDLIALEVRRLEFVLFKEHIGRRCWVFPVRTFGQRCPNCFDPVSGQQYKTECETCFDTSFVRGYLDPIETYVQFDPTPKHLENSQIAETHQENCSARLLDFPPLKPRDIIVEVENRRWRVERVSTTQRLRAVLHQEVVLHAVPMSDMEWRLPIRVADLAAMEPSPEREFRNAHSLDEHKEAEFLNAATAVYGYRGGRS